MTTQNTWTPEQLKRFKEAYDAKPCQTAKDAIKRLAPEAFEVKPYSGSIYLRDKHKAYVLVSTGNGPDNGPFVLGSLSGGRWSLPMDMDRVISCGFRRMMNGRINITIKNGVTANCLVDETP